MTVYDNMTVGKTEFLSGALATGNSTFFQAAAGMQAGIAGYAIGAFFLSAEYQKLFWLVVFLSIYLRSRLHPDTAPGSSRIRASAGESRPAPATVSREALVYAGHAEGNGL